MNDILLGTIIGGTIAAVVALIQGHYSLKGKREENLYRQQQQSIQIQHEKNSQLISRIIEIRANYLNPISEQLGKLQTSMSDFRDKLLDVIVPYLLDKSEEREENEVQVEAAQKQEFIKKLESVDSILPVIEICQTRIHEACISITDVKLGELLHDLSGKVYSLREAYYKMEIDLAEITNVHDFVYDFEKILKPVRYVSASIGIINMRIESLLAGADAGDK